MSIVKILKPETKALIMNRYLKPALQLSLVLIITMSTLCASAQTPENNMMPVTTLPSEDALLTPLDIDAVPAEAVIDLEEIDPNLYFDTETFVPTSELSEDSVPKRLNPVKEPASRFIVVNKKHDKNSIQARLVSAQRASSLGRHEAALTIYEDLKARSPKDINVLSGIAVTLQHLGNQSEAIEAYEDILDIAPDNLEAHINMLGLVSQRYPAVALQRLMSLQDKNPNNISLIAQVAYVQARTGRYNDALNTYATAASIDPKNAGHYFNMAVVADKAGMVSDAIQYYEKALDVDTIYAGGRSSIPREEIFDRLANLR